MRPDQIYISREAYLLHVPASGDVERSYCYNSALLFTTEFLSWPMETTIASS